MEKTIDVIFSVKVNVDESKFTLEFMEHFSRYFYEFETIEEHMEHIAQLAARDMLDTDFTEGYGALKDMGISAKVLDIVTEVA